MEERMNKRLVAGLIFAVLLIGLVAGGLFLYQSSRFRLVSSTPKLSDSLPTSTSTIKLHFSKPLDDSKDYRATLLEQDPFIVSTIEVTGNDIYVHLRKLEKGKRYRFTIKDITAKDGRVIMQQSVAFEAKFVPYSQLSADQKRLELSQTDRTTPSDPILAYMPHQGDRFYLKAEHTTSEEDEEILVINADLFLSRDDIKTGRSAAIQQYKDRVTQFIRSKDLDPDKYYIRYVINEPPASPN